MPEVYNRARRHQDALERHYRDMQDIEFTVQEGRLYILQTRSGKRTAAAAVRIAVEMAREGLFDDRHRPRTRADKAGRPRSCASSRIRCTSSS